MRTFYQEVLQIEPHSYRGNYVEFTPRLAPSRSGASPSVQRLGLVSARRRESSVLIELEVADVERSMPG